MLLIVHLIDPIDGDEGEIYGFANVELLAVSAQIGVDVHHIAVVDNMDTRFATNQSATFSPSGSHLAFLDLNISNTSMRLRLWSNDGSFRVQPEDPLLRDRSAGCCVQRVVLGVVR